jgi:SAM-dependent methyltransferase
VAPGPDEDDAGARWDARHREAAPREPSSFLQALDPILPRSDGSGDRTPRVLDVAGGPGHNAVWLAARGLDVTLADVSAVALDLARQAARAAGVSLRLLQVNLERASLPAGPFDLIVSLNFLWRPLFAVYPSALARGGLLVFLHPTRRNLERNPSPSARYLLDDGEVRHLLQGLEVVRLEEGWFDGRHEARLVARRPG